MGTTCPEVRITHPFHPSLGQALDVVCRRLQWGEDRIVYADTNGTLRSIATGLTDAEPPNEFQRVADGKAAFRTIDLLLLCDLLDGLNGADCA